jgi:predicted dinucleotide-binding enzyme
VRVGILGTGEVGKALGTGFVELGHEVKMGAREAGNEKAAAWVSKTGSRASAGSFADAARFGEMIVVATLGTATEAILRQAGPENFAGKVVIDATNPLVFAEGKPPALEVGHTDSRGEQVQRWLPKARVVKCFNTVGYAHMVHPDFPGGPPEMFFCGNDAQAKEQVTGILKAFGWNAVDLGGIEVSRVLEPICILWVLYGIRTGGWNHAVTMLRK